MKGNGNSKFARAIESVEQRLKKIEIYLNQRDWFLGPSWVRSALNWIVVFLVPVVVVIIGTPIMDKVFGSHDTRLHVGIREIVENSIAQDLRSAQDLNDRQASDEGIIEIQYEYEISIANVGSSEARKDSGNELMIEFGEEISDVYATSRRGPGIRVVKMAATEFESCKGKKKCDARWSSLGPRGVLSVRFAFLNRSGELQDVPHIVSGKRPPIKWMCCGLSPELENECEALSENDLYSLFESDEWFNKDGCGNFLYKFPTFGSGEGFWTGTGEGFWANALSP